jgi:hypothetical protein
LEKLAESISAVSSALANQVLLNHERFDLHNPLIHKTNPMLAHLNKEFEDKGYSAIYDKERYHAFLANKVKQHKELFEDYRPRHAQLIDSLSDLEDYKIPTAWKDSDKVLSNKIDELFS